MSGRVVIEYERLGDVDGNDIKDTLDAGYQGYKLPDLA